jgi:2-keto-3-deoxy-L-rhamnonate aldolase RhmA
MEMKKRLLGGEVLFGVVIRSVDIAVAELVALVGFDFGWIDMEHSTLSFSEVAPLIIALENRDCVPVVRVPSTDANSIGKPLDLGAGVVVVPHVDTAAAAEHVVRSAKYFPRGMRGYASCSRSNRQGMEALDEATMRRMNDENMIAVQIESRMGIENVDEIARVDGVDVIFLGLGDLSQDLGVPGQLGHQMCREAIEAVSEAARRNHKIAAASITKVEALHHFVSKGFTMVTCGVDTLLMRDSLKDRLLRFQGSAGR